MGTVFRDFILDIRVVKLAMLFESCFKRLNISEGIGSALVERVGLDVLDMINTKTKNQTRDVKKN